MSTAIQTQTDAVEESLAGESPSGRIYRGRTVAELIPRIQADLGPQAIVLRRRSGLAGGIGGFFQRPFVEIEARGGSVDLYDGGTETPASADFAALALEDLSALDTTPQPSPQPELGAFADALTAAGISVSDTRTGETATAPSARHPMLSAYTATLQELASLPETTPMPEPLPEPQEPAAAHLPLPAKDTTQEADCTPAPTESQTGGAARSRTRLAIVKELLASGMDQPFAEDLIDTASAHLLVFNPRIGLRNAVRIELERRIPAASPLPSTGAAIVLAGPGGSGKSRCVDSLARIYKRSETTQPVCTSLLADGQDGALKIVLDPTIATSAEASSPRALRALTAARAEGIALIDTPSLSPADRNAIKALGKLLGAVQPDRIVVALPATLGARATSQLLQAMQPLKPNALAITHADETDQLGVAVQAACRFGIAPEYLLSGGRDDRALSRLDPATLAQRLLR
jgi:flagellar biosynthesis protein FlhF